MDGMTLRTYTICYVRYDSVSHNAHAPKQNRGLSLETATTITVWTTIVAFSSRATARAGPAQGR